MKTAGYEAHTLLTECLKSKIVHEQAGINKKRVLLKLLLLILKKIGT